MAILLFLCAILGGTPALGARIHYSNVHAKLHTEGQGWTLDIKALNCFNPNFSPIHGLNATMLARQRDPRVAAKEKATSPIQLAALEAMEEMANLALSHNCRWCDASFWGNYESGNKPSHWTVKCAAELFGKGTNYPGHEGACFSAKDMTTEEVLETEPLPGLAVDDCRQCPPQCETCEPEYTGMVSKELVGFKCNLKEKPLAEKMSTPVPGYYCKVAKKRRTRPSQFKTHCKLPGKASKCVRKHRPDKRCVGVAPTYKELWPASEAESKTSNQIKIDLGVVDCVSPFASDSQSWLRLGENIKDWEVAKTTAEQRLWKIAAAQNVEHCRLGFKFEHGKFDKSTGVTVKHAVKELGKEACSSRNGPLPSRFMTKLGGSCSRGSAACCVPCPHVCKSCKIDKEGKHFHCLPKSLSPAFPGKLALFLNPGDSEEALSKGELEPIFTQLKGYNCWGETLSDIQCSIGPKGTYYAVLPVTTQQTEHLANGQYLPDEDDFVVEQSEWSDPGNNTDDILAIQSLPSPPPSSGKLPPPPSSTPPQPKPPPRVSQPKPPSSTPPVSAPQQQSKNMVPDPRYEKYWKLKKRGVPTPAITAKMLQEAPHLSISALDSPTVPMIDAGKLKQVQAKQTPTPVQKPSGGRPGLAFNAADLAGGAKMLKKAKSNSVQKPSGGGGSGGGLMDGLAAQLASRKKKMHHVEAPEKKPPPPARPFIAEIKKFGSGEKELHHVEESEKNSKPDFDKPSGVMGDMFDKIASVQKSMSKAEGGDEDEAGCDEEKCDDMQEWGDCDNCPDEECCDKCCK